MSQAREADQRDQRLRPSCKPEGAGVERVLSFTGLRHLALLSLAGQVLVPSLIGQSQAAHMDASNRPADLIYRQGIRYLAVTLDVPEPPAEDRGIVLRIAPVSPAGGKPLQQHANAPMRFGTACKNVARSLPTDSAKSFPENRPDFRKRPGM